MYICIYMIMYVYIYINNTSIIYGDITNDISKGHFMAGLNSATSHFSLLKSLAMDLFQNIWDQQQEVNSTIYRVDITPVISG